jgi:thioredoxin reductase (NADPH)
MAEQSGTNKRPQVKILGRIGSAPCYAIRDFLWRCDVPFEWIELATDDAARTWAGVQQLSDARLPVCLFPDGTRMECPTIR